MDAEFPFGSERRLQVSALALQGVSAKPVVVVGTIVQANATSPNVFIGSRVLVGFGNVINYTIAPVIIAELAHPRQRGPAATM